MRAIVLKYVLFFVLIGVCSNAPSTIQDKIKIILDHDLCARFIKCIPEFRNPGSFYCSVGLEIDKKKVCNGVNDCWDGSDEYPQYCVYHNATEEGKKTMDEELSGNCGSDEFQCQPGECIEGDKSCDGQRDCTNGLDETPEICLREECPNETYTCAYGACINRNQVCNGVIDCADGSDEIINKKGCKLKELIPLPRVENETIVKYENYCHVPSQNKLVIADMNATDHKLINDEFYIPLDTSVKFECAEGFATSEYISRLFACGKNSKWDTALPKCIRKCAKLPSDVSIILTCSNQDYELVNCDAALAGTKANINCAYGYHGTKEWNLICQDDGEWRDNDDSKLTKNVCEQTCGKIEEPKQTMSSNGHSVETYLLPWHVALYNVENEQHTTYWCSGSILNANWILTAAHCVLDKYDELFSNNMFLVVANKQFKPFDQNNLKNNSEIQKRNISDIKLHELYKPKMTEYQYDIALMKLAEPLIFNTRVKPICGPTEYMIQNPLNNATFGAYSHEKSEISVLSGQVKKGENTIAIYEADGRGLIERGDSGGGIFIKGKDEIRYIRGVLSNANRSPDSNKVYISDMHNKALVLWIKKTVPEFYKLVG